jgi:acetyl-CoA C-acetyltransferase
MPEAVIVATARTPIGRAFKGSMTELRPDDLTATIIKAAMDKVPQVTPDMITDLHLGCGLPGGEPASTWPASSPPCSAGTTSRARP